MVPVPLSGILCRLQSLDWTLAVVSVSFWNYRKVLKLRWILAMVSVSLSGTLGHWETENCTQWKEDYIFLALCDDGKVGDWTLVTVSADF